MNGIISREDIFRQRCEQLNNGNLVLGVFQIAEEYGIVQELDLENTFTLAAIEYIRIATEKNEYAVKRGNKLYQKVCNVYYVVELYLRGFYKKERAIKYEEFINAVIQGRSLKVIEEAHEAFVLRINRLKKIIAKSKKKLPRHSHFCKNIRGLLNQLEKDVSLCERYPLTAINLSEFYFAKFHEMFTPLMSRDKTGFIALERTIYSLYNEICILSKFNTNFVDRVCNNYIGTVGFSIDFNVFEKAVNNYLFAIPYSDDPEELEISKVDAELLIREIKIHSIDVNELVDQLIDKYEFTGYNAKYLKEYGEFTQKRVERLRSSNSFGELFVITPHYV